MGLVDLWEREAYYSFSRIASYPVSWCYHTLPETGQVIMKSNLYLTVLEIGESKVWGSASDKGLAAAW